MIFIRLRSLRLFERNFFISLGETEKQIPNPLEILNSGWIRKWPAGLMQLDLFVALYLCTAIQGEWRTNQFNTF